MIQFLVLLCLIPHLFALPQKLNAVCFMPSKGKFTCPDVCSNAVPKGACPQDGSKTLQLGGSLKDIAYTSDTVTIQSQSQLDCVVPIVKTVAVTITHDDFVKAQGSAPSQCSQNWASYLNDIGRIGDSPQCKYDAGHIIGAQFGGSGTEPLNIFPQDPNTNSGVASPFEKLIGSCLKAEKTATAKITLQFYYKDQNYKTRPSSYDYNVDFTFSKNGGALDQSCQSLGGKQGGGLNFSAKKTINNPCTPV